MSATEFRTFCHISEYGADGYRNLHRMIAASTALVLWAPSSTLLSSDGCKVGEREYVDYVTAGHVRVIARENWLISRRFRDGHPWAEGAPWIPLVDDEIRRIAEEDATKPMPQRRVIIAPAEAGKEWAEQYVVENPSVLRAVERVVHRGADDLPAGVLETARRYSSDPRGAAVQVLRQAYNHGDAIAASGATAPFFLANQDSKFLRWIAEFDSSDDALTARRRRRSAHQDYARLADELLDLLRTLDLVGDLSDLRRFVGSEGHAQLANWYARICECAAVEHPSSIEGKLYRELAQDLDDAHLSNTLRSWLAKKEPATEFSLGLSTGVAGLAFDGPTVLSIAGVLLGALPVGRGLLKRLGFVAADYTGMQWPFLYTYGRNASGRRIGRLRRALGLPPNGRASG
jgi:hypothetical protein